MDEKVYDLKIDPELRDFIPPLQPREFELLTKRLLTDGCIEPLVVWNGTVIDGHNRYKICHKYNIPFTYREMDFTDKKAAQVWMAENQLGRRNLNTFQKCEIIVPVEEPLSASLKEKAEQRRREKISDYRSGNETGGECPSSELEKTRSQIAKMADTSPRTYSKAKFLIENADHELLNDLRTGSVSINKAYSKLKKPEENNEKEKDEPVEDIVPSFEPTGYIDHPTEDPVTHTEPERIPRPYQFVKEQLEFAVDNMIADMKVGVYSLRNEDFDKKTELKNIMMGGYERAVHIIDGLEKLG